MLVTVDRGETRVAVLEAEGEPSGRGASEKVRDKLAPGRGRGSTSLRGVPKGYRVAEIYMERPGRRSIVGNIYKGRVDKAVGGLEAAFVDIGLEKNGFLHVDDIVMPGVEVRRRGRGGGGGGGKRIAELLKAGQEVVVQVEKDPLKTKGARLSMQVSIAGRYLVYVPQGEGVGVSRRLETRARDRLRKEAAKLNLEGGGAIIRTAAADGAKREDFERELRYLFKLNEILHARVEETAAPAMVFQEADLSVRVARDVSSAHLERALVDDPKQRDRLTSFFERTAPELADRVELYEDGDPLFESLGVEDAIQSTLNRRVDLPSGGYLIIDYTEALTVIDVNSGSYVARGRGSGLEDTITTTNLEAAEEVVRQLRLRDIGGIIVIDFIDMARARNREAVLGVLRKALDEDRTKSNVVEISPLGLVEMTRQNVTDGVREIVTKACPTCEGEGVVLSEESVAIAVERRLRELAAERPAAEAYLVQLHPSVVASLMAGPDRRLHELESEIGKRFHFEGSEALPLDHFALTLDGTRADVEQRALPFEVGDEVLVGIEEPHMYNEDDAVAKLDGYVVSVKQGGRFIGERKLVRIDEVKRTSASASIVGEAGQPEGGRSGLGDGAASASASASDGDGDDEGKPRRRGRRGGRRRGRRAEPGPAGVASEGSDGSSE